MARAHATVTNYWLMSETPKRSSMVRFRKLSMKLISPMLLFIFCVPVTRQSFLTRQRLGSIFCGFINPGQHRTFLLPGVTKGVTASVGFNFNGTKVQ
jgi:hypothetical protein